MVYKGRAESYGAISVINAIGFGKGAALSIELKTVADVEFSEDKDLLQIEIVGEPDEDTSLAQNIIKKVFKRFNRGRMGGAVRTSSDIPIGRGLKSSSVASNAITLATLSALNQMLDDTSIIEIGVEASLEAGVTITGAYDDACASYYGGLVVTDNLERRILKMDKVDNDLQVLIYVPSEKMYTRDVDVEGLECFNPLREEVFRLAMKGDYWKSLTLNGLLCSAGLDISAKPIVDALKHGALAAGVSGTGPAIAAICRPEKVDSVSLSWAELKGEVIHTRVNNRRARVIQI